MASRAEKWVRTCGLTDDQRDQSARAKDSGLSSLGDDSRFDKLIVAFRMYQLQRSSEPATAISPRRGGNNSILLSPSASPRPMVR